MLCSLSRVFRNLGAFFSKPDLSVTAAFESALEQEVPFQLEIQHNKDQCTLQALRLKAVAPEWLVLASPDPIFAVPAYWLNKMFRFRFVIRPHPTEPPQLHVFKGCLLLVDEDKKTITVGLPKNILAIEQRRNVRIKLQRKHLPDLVLWGAHKNTGEAAGVSLNHCLVLDLKACDQETAAVVKNISAGGMRLTLAPQILTRHKEWLELGRKLIIQMVFCGPECPWPSKHMFVARISNTRTQFVSRPELGVQFLASRVREPKPAWKKLDDSGCEELARVIHEIQKIYHTEAKLPPPVRPGSPSDEVNQYQRPSRPGKEEEK